MESGKVDLSVGADRHLLQGPSFWSAYPGPTIRFQPAAGFASWVHRYLAFKGPLVWRWQRDGLFPVPPQSVAKGKHFAKRFDELLASTRRADRRSHLKAIHRLEGILLDLAETSPPPQLTTPWFDLAMRRITDWAALDATEHDRPPDYAALADELQTSRSTLRRRFVEATGTSPHGFYLQCRVARARQLLGTTELPVKTIALKLGYRDVYFFSRQFKQLIGVPPATYRKSRQG